MPAQSAPNPTPQEGAATRQRVIQLAGPSLVEMFLVSLVQMVNMMMVGRLGPAAVASVGLTNQPMMFFQSTYMALNVGTTALIARLVGAGEHERASEAAKQTLVLAMLIGLAISGMTYALAEQILVLMGAGDDVIGPGILYLRTVSIGLTFNALAMNITASLRGAGDTRSPMYVNLVVNALNAVGCYVLVNGELGFPAMGVAGAGIAASFARFVSFLIFLAIVAANKRRIHVNFRDGYKLDWPLLQRAFTVGLPACAEQLILRAGQVAFARVVSSLGTATYAAHAIGLNVLSMSFMPGQAFAVAATTLVGQALGAQDPARAERDARETRKIGVIVGTSMAFIFLFFARPIAWLYTDDAEVIALTAMVLRFYAFVQPAQSSQFILAGALRGAGDAKWALYSSAIGVWLGRFLLSYVLINHFGFGLLGAWMAMGVDQMGRWLITGMRFGTGRWKHQRV